jgi:hypothetical protein
MIIKTGVLMSNITILSVFFIIFISSSCSFFQSVTEKNFELLSGLSNGASLSKKQIEDNLTIKETLAMNTFKVNLFPLIPVYLEKFRSSDLLLKNIPDTQDKTCFIAEITSDSSNPKTTDFNTWKAEALDFENDFIHMEWTAETLKQKATTTVIASYHGAKKRYHNRGILCAVDTIETTRYFQVKLSPAIVQWPLKDDIRFNWRVPYKTVVNGVEVIKRKKKKIQSYKGW